MRPLTKVYYKSIPCWYDKKTGELFGKNLFYDILLDIVLWFDINIIEIEDFTIWEEYSEDEKL